MADYWISFRVDGSGHPRRYDALIAAMNENGTGFWDGPTSFVCMTSALTIEALGAKLKAAIDPRYDLFVMREIGKDDTRYAGLPGDGFTAFFPKAKKL